MTDMIQEALVYAECLGLISNARGANRLEAMLTERAKRRIGSPSSVLTSFWLAEIAVTDGKIDPSQFGWIETESAVKSIAGALVHRPTKLAARTLRVDWQSLLLSKLKSIKDSSQIIESGVRFGVGLALLGDEDLSNFPEHVRSCNPKSSTDVASILADYAQGAFHARAKAPSR